MLRKYLYLSMVLMFFGIGVYVWKIQNTGINIPDSEVYDVIDRNNNLVYIEDEAITHEDIEWEFELLTLGVFEDEDITSIPEVGDKEEALKNLRERLIANLIERKLLFAFIRQDGDFSISDPARYTECVGKWQETIEQKSKFFSELSSKRRLKNRLCERSIILQYLKEKIFSRIKVDHGSIAHFYSKNIRRFKFPKRVVIRQIVLASEREAKKIRHKVRHHNFEKYAKEVSITPEAKDGGLIGPFAKGDMPRIFDVAFTMRRGEIKGILKSTYGFHIIKLEKKLPKSKLSLVQATPVIEKELRKQLEEKEYQKWVELALSAISIKSPKSL